MKTYVPSRPHLVIVTVYYWNTVHCEVRAEVKQTGDDLNMEFDFKFVANTRRNLTALLCKTSEGTFKVHTTSLFVFNCLVI
jgi:hypothetical protein